MTNTTQAVEIAIIGAGIQGAAVAQAAAAAGYSCRVLEQYATPAQGTSSRSSKLIHGGLRYLESGQFRLVRECLRERALLLRNAPQLVRLVPFHIPVYRHTRRSLLSLYTGLNLYRLLGGGAFRRLPVSEWNRLDGIRTDGLRAVLQYQDAQTDDAALTRAVLASAQGLGAQLEYSAQLLGGAAHGQGYRLTYRRHDDTHQLDAQWVINAAGPWVNQVLDLFQPAVPALAIELVAGTHIEVPGRLARGMYYLEAPQDQRAVFVMPWRERLLIGTTERPYRGDPAAVTPTEEEIGYLLAVHNHYFAQPLSRQDVLSAYAGLRVLPASNSNAFHRPRDSILHPDRPERPRLITLYGGKLTAFRATAQAVMRMLRPQLPPRRAIADTAQLPLQG